MTKRKIQRRRVLSGLAVAGSTGFVAGSGTTALMSDSEVFTGNTIRASESVAGTVKLTVRVVPLPDVPGVEYRISLPEGVNNNPSYVWVRTIQCPRPPQLAESLSIKLDEICGENLAPETINQGRLNSVLDDLRTGKLLCPDDACLRPGETRRVRLQITDSHAPDADGPVEFQLEFYGEQCRYVSPANNPFTEDEVIEPCTTEGQTPTPSAAQSISFIAFCSTTGNMLSPTDDSVIKAITDRDDSDDPLAVEWMTANDVDYLTVKSGQNYTIYDHRDSQKTSGSVETGGDPDATFYGVVNNNGPASSAPCQLASDVVGDGSFPEAGTTLKIEWDGDQFVEETND